ncbi:MAG TPA: LacI family DNA-binding transcriptional regulator, partial [Gemmatimonadales bacterium]|nr:LacI family DNA-binding transcriptional regulator [Gemmatimonadales bacterium]
MSTIHDVAKAAGVSVSTVSRALRGLDRVSPQTRDRVTKAALDLRYVASPTASSLASGRTRVVAVVVPFLTRWFFATLISGIEKALRRQGHHVLLVDLEGESFDSRLRLSQDML